MILNIITVDNIAKMQGSLKAINRYEVSQNSKSPSSEDWKLISYRSRGSSDSSFSNSSKVLRTNLKWDVVNFRKNGYLMKKFEWIQNIEVI